MFKKYRTLLVITSLLTLSPILAGILLWKQLPDEIATHFGVGNVANGWSSKPFAVFGLPFFMLFIHLICFFGTANDPKVKNINHKVIRWVLWMIPVLSIVTCLSCYAIALGYQVDIGMIVNLLIGILFIGIGNYMHKIKQNYTVGIKIPWTLHSEENWNRTHRLSSWLWILCGVVLLINSVVKLGCVLGVVIVALVLAPMIYSFALYKKGI